MTDPSRGDPGVCGGHMEVFVEPIQPDPTVVVIGVGHIGKTVAHLAHWLGFRVVVNDDRPEFCTSDVVPEADEYKLVGMAELPSQLEITPWTYLILTTRGTDVDVEGLPALLETPAAYIGVIGSRRRWATARKALLAKGIPEETLARVRSPIGLELNAETPEEIAVSIMAEIIMLRRGGDGREMSNL
jgi:xanthine dehydrogenase accessory factor